MDKRTITHSFNFDRPKMKQVTVRNRQVQSVRVIYKESDTNIEIEIHPRVNTLGEDGKSLGDLIGPGETLQMNEL